MKEQITLFSYLLFLIAASRLYDPLSGAMVNMAGLFAVDLQGETSERHPGFLGGIPECGVV